MTKEAKVSAIFYAAAAYDGVLGLAFLVAAGPVFTLFQVTPPNHFGYVQFPAALLLVFAVMFLVVARRPFPNRKLIPYGILLKASYVGVVGWYWLFSDIPGMWKPFAVADLAFGILFWLAYVGLGKKE